MKMTELFLLTVYPCTLSRQRKPANLQNNINHLGKLSLPGLIIIINLIAKIFTSVKQT